MELKELKRAVLREEYMSITDSNIIEALILNQLIYWSQRIYDFDKFIIEEKQRFENEGQSINIDLQNGWIYKSADEFKDELMLKETTKTIKRHLTSLEERGFIDKRRNPKIKYDRTYQYRVNMFNIIVALKKNNYTLQDYRVDFNYHELENLKSLNRQNIHDENQKVDLDRTNFPTNGKNVPSKGNIVASSGKNVATIPETTTEITSENISETTTTIFEPNKFVDDVAVESSNFQNINSNDFKTSIENISNIFNKITSKKPNSNDFNTIKEILTHETKTEISLIDRENMVAKAISSIYSDFKSRNPLNKINSFKYFYQAIIDEFEKYEELKNLSQSKYKRSNDSNTNSEPICSDDVDDFFRLAWSKYPKQEGKNEISITQKLVLSSIKDEFLRCIDRYLQSDKDLKINGGWKELQSGKTFFNSGYLEWTDKEFENKQLNPVKSAAEIRKERILALCRANEEARNL